MELHKATLRKHTIWNFGEDTEGDDNRDVQFGNLRDDDDWVLDAMYNEPLRLRSFTTHKLWNRLHTLYYQEDEEDAKPGADVMYVEVFLNQKYVGIYLLSEQIDRKQLQLKDFKDGEIRGELYKAVNWQRNVTYDSIYDYDNNSILWGGHEVKYPDSDDTIDWSNLYEFTDFVINSDAASFENEIDDYLKFDNAIDYFIFLNAVRARDNSGKNIYTAKYNTDEPYFFIPWDLDGVFGTNWRGEDEDVVNTIHSNNLFRKLFMENTTQERVEKLQNRWSQLRTTVLNTDNLSGEFNNQYNTFLNEKIYERESLAWQNYPYDTNAKNYLDDWIDRRMLFLDEYFGNLLLSNEDLNKLSSEVNVYPNPSNGDFYIEYQNFTKPLNYRILNSSAIIVARGKIDSNKTLINSNMLADGIYFFIAEGIQKKIVIQN